MNIFQCTYSLEIKILICFFCHFSPRYVRFCSCQELSQNNIGLFCIINKINNKHVLVNEKICHTIFIFSVFVGSHAEYLIALMNSLLFAMLFSFAVPLILLVKKVERIFSLLIATFLISLAVLLLTPLGFPYSGGPDVLAPQRFMIAVSIRKTFRI